MLTFKLAQSGDSKLILKYIRDLAIAEEFPFEISATLSDIEANLLGKDATAKALILQIDEKPCGFAVYYYTFSTTTGKRGLHLDDLYIEPEFQGNGVGKKTLIYLAQLAKEKGCARFEWWALKTNDSAIKFYSNIGAKKLDEISVFRLNLPQIESLAEDNKPMHATSA
ncbi:Acetyltransferase (GNAT) family protein [Marinomonas spartinae]|uniref:Acetyltransferase (GNAT) family protein n=1 Tax=Marinomonas spartinae TaxID=1792290 RepID=A0A1A8TNZ5_9GAMM|nr:GNAT family N-acetyltransferase [Marinomonas spartinae]SBS34991.1 Acetyltransferase (GNAT) family protein [Marinomonas spartinae]SBS38884.1 Acetyltransferase (GNAT) family protein [Marinomonas spartinae]